MKKATNKHHKVPHHKTEVPAILQRYKVPICALGVIGSWAVAHFYGGIFDSCWPLFKSAVRQCGVRALLSDVRGMSGLLILMAMLYLKYAFILIGGWYAKQVRPYLPKDLRSALKT